MNIDLTQIIIALIGVLATILTTVVVPYFKSKLTTEQTETLSYWVDVAVLAAEGVFVESGLGKDKYEYVVNFLHEKGLKFNEDEIKTVIESAVYSLINQVKTPEVNGND